MKGYYLEQENGFRFTAGSYYINKSSQEVINNKLPMLIIEDGYVIYKTKNGIKKRLSKVIN